MTGVDTPAPWCAHLSPGGDLVWEIGSGYFGCRASAREFDPASFAQKAALDAVKAVSIKLSQGTNPAGQ